MFSARLMLILLCTLPLSSWADNWKMGVGVGLSSTSMDFDQWTFKDTANNSHTLSGDLNSDDVREYMDSGTGLAFFAKQDKWTILLSTASVTMEDDIGGSVREWEWTRDSFQVSAIYDFAKTGANTFGVLVGAVNTSHELEIDAGGGFAAPVDVDEDWTDAILGFTHSLLINQNLSWSSRIDVGSEGRAYFDTGLTVKIGDHFQVRPQVAIVKYDYENGDIADADHYVYDATETMVGAGLSFVF